MQPTLNIATRAARAAGDLIARALDRLDTLTVNEKSRNDFASEVDRLAEQEIINILQRYYPTHAILAEESGEHGQGEHVWIIDPLDGTTNFLHGFPQFAVSIALEYRGRLEQAVVYDPLRQEMYTASRGAGAALNNRRIRVTAQSGFRGALLGTGFPFRNAALLDPYLKMFRDLSVEAAGIRRPGSAALDLAYVAAGRLDGFWEIGLHPWDWAAGVLLVQEAGGIVTDFSGTDGYRRSGNILAANPRLHQLMQGKIAPHLAPELGVV